MDDLARFALVTFPSVLFIVDPIAAVPTYLVITQLETPLERRRTARRAFVIILSRLGKQQHMLGRAASATQRVGPPLSRASPLT